MKRLFPLIILIIFISSCAPSYDILSYQDGSLRAQCIINEKYRVIISKENDTRALEILEPSSLCGAKLFFDGTRWSATLDTFSLELDAGSIKGIIALCSIFDLENSAITTAHDSDGYGVVTFDMDELQYTVTYNSLSLPQRIKITGALLDYDIEVLSIERI